MNLRLPVARVATIDLADRRRTILASGVSLAVVGMLFGIQMLGGVSKAHAEAPVVSPLLQNFTFAPIVDRVRPAVVSIRVKGEAPGPRESFAESFPDLPEGGPLDRFFYREWGSRGGAGGPGHGNHRGPRSGGQVVMSQGSGFIISASGRVVTNYHVVKGGGEVTVVTDDGTEYRAKVKGSDEKTDIALLEIQGGKTDFPTVPFATTDVRPGDWVLAVGNPFGLGGSVTAGIVSARGREIGAGPYDDFLQIDAPINRGNSGGPTFDLQGNVVGVNTAIYSPSGGSVGIGFAIPSATVQKVIAQLETNGTVVRGWLGVQIQPIGRDMADGLGLKDARGALVSQTQPGTPAAKAGLAPGDAIVALDGRPVKNPRDLSRLVAGFEPGSKVTLTVSRDGKERPVEVELGRLPDDPKVAAATPGDDGATPTSLTDLGLALAPASEVGESGGGVAVVDVDPASPAAARGLRPGDIVLEVQGKAVATVGDVEQAVKRARLESRKAVLLRVKSAEGLRFLPLPLVGS